MRDIPGLHEAIEEHKQRVRPRPEMYSGLRFLVRIMGCLSADSPLRQQLVTLAGCGDTSFPEIPWGKYRRTLLRQLEEAEADRPDVLAKTEAIKDAEPDKRKAYEQDDGLVVERLSDVMPREVDWLWEQRMPLGALTILSGDPDAGKSWVCYDICARLTTGRAFPDAPNPFGGQRRDVLWVSSEDSSATTQRPRLDILKGDPSRFHNLKCVLDGGRVKTFDLGKHLERFENYLKAYPLISLAVLDPLAAFFGKTDTHKNSDVRALLTPLSRLSDLYQVSILGINHLNKGEGSAMHRQNGSIGIVAAARSSWQVSADPDDKERRLVTKVKNNLATVDVGGLAFRFLPDGKGISWEEGVRVETTADEALRRPDETKAPAKAAAKQWLRNLLGDGPKIGVKELAKYEGMCWKTVCSAATDLGVIKRKTGGTGAGWEWSLPEKADG